MPELGRWEVGLSSRGPSHYFHNLRGILGAPLGGLLFGNLQRGMGTFALFDETVGVLQDFGYHEQHRPLLIVFSEAGGVLAEFGEDGLFVGLQLTAEALPDFIVEDASGLAGKTDGSLGVNFYRGGRRNAP